MKASDYLKKRKEAGGSTRQRIETLERKNWHLTQILGAILFASENPEEGFTFLEADALSVDVKDVEYFRNVDDRGKGRITVRIKEVKSAAS